MLCPKCGATAIQRRQVDMLEHGATELLTCLLCGEILHEMVISSYDVIPEDQYQNKTVYVRGGFNKMKCAVDGCDRKAECKYLCNMHYQRFAKYRKQLDRLQSTYSDVIHVATGVPL